MHVLYWLNEIPSKYFSGVMDDMYHVMADKGIFPD